MIGKTEFTLEKSVAKLLERARKKFKGTDREFDKKIEKNLPGILQKAQRFMLRETVKQLSQGVARRVRSDQQVVKKIARQHDSSLTTFDLFLQFNLAMGESLYKKYRKVMSSFDDHLKLDTLTEIHARACQVAAEIRLLVRNGYADGAYARWRSLHELCIAFLFLYDAEDETIRMYLDYEVIETWEKLKKYQDSFPKLGWKPVTQKEVQAIEAQRNALIALHGKEYAKGYGWTMRILKSGERNIRGIETHVGKGYLRGIYSWASENVHAGISGNRQRLGSSNMRKRVFLTCPTDQGLFDPIQFTSYSLMEMTQTMLLLEDSIMHRTCSALLEDMHNLLVKDFVSEIKTMRKKEINKRRLRKK